LKRLSATVLLLLLPLLTLAAETPPPPSPAPQAKPDVRLTETGGKVTLTLGGCQGEPIQGELPLAEGDMIQTGTTGYAEISIDGTTLVRVEPDSTLRIRRLSPKRILLGLRSGVVLAKVNFDKKAGATFVIFTPVASASVRGTEFVIVQKGNKAHVGVLDEGHVAVTAPGFKKEVMLRFNQETTIQKGSPPADLKVLERLYSYKNTMSDMRQRIKTVRKQGTLTIEQCQMMRTGWIKTNAPPPPPPSVRKKQRTR
jgi:hypothetical protein